MPVLAILLAMASSQGPERAPWYTPEEIEAHHQRLDTCTRIPDRVAALLDIASIWMLSNKAGPHLREADSLLTVLERDPRAEVRRSASGSRGFYHYHMGYQAKFHRDMRGALHHFQRALDLAREQGLGDQVEHLAAIGLVHRAVGLPRSAITVFEEAIRIEVELGTPRPRLMSQLRADLASVHADLGEWDKAEAQLAACDTTDPRDLAAVLVERARIRELRGDPQGATALMERAAVVVMEAPFEWDRIGVLQPKARMHLAFGEPARALADARECARIAAETGDEAAECGCLLLAGSARMRAGDARGAEHDLERGLGLARSQGYLGLARESGDEGSAVHAAGLLKNLYRSQGRIAEALEMTTLWATLNDSLHAMDGRADLLRFSLQEATLKDSIETAQRIERATASLRADRDRAFAAGGAVLLLLAGGVAWYRADRRRRRERFAKEAALLETKALRAQMNPHFIFNALNSVHEHILANERDLAAEFVVKFARLMRLVLENSRHAEIPLAQDLEALGLYLELERDRLEGKFDHEVAVDPDIDQEQVMVPPLVLQPFVENAIWHGIAAKEGRGRIGLRIGRENGHLTMVLDDDGPGRGQAAMGHPGKTSLGTAITGSRLELFGRQHDRPASFRYVERERGTRVEVRMPLVMA